jgi:DNA-binding XRE family transcriptional regulator
VRPADVAAVSQIRAELASGAARTARIATGARQSDIAEALGVDRSAVGHWETGKSVPSAEHALAYSRLLRQLAKKAA